MQSTKRSALDERGGEEKQIFPFAPSWDGKDYKGGSWHLLRWPKWLEHRITFDAVEEFFCGSAQTNLPAAWSGDGREICYFEFVADAACFSNPRVKGQDWTFASGSATTKITS